MLTDSSRVRSALRHGFKRDCGTALLRDAGLHRCWSRVIGCRFFTRLACELLPIAVLFEPDADAACPPVEEYPPVDEGDGEAPGVDGNPAPAWSLISVVSWVNFARRISTSSQSATQPSHGISSWYARLCHMPAPSASPSSKAMRPSSIRTPGQRGLDITARWSNSRAPEYRPRKRSTQPRTVRAGALSVRIASQACSERHAPIRSP